MIEFEVKNPLHKGQLKINSSTLCDDDVKNTDAYKELLKFSHLLSKQLPKKEDESCSEDDSNDEDSSIDADARRGGAENSAVTVIYGEHKFLYENGVCSTSQIEMLPLNNKKPFKHNYGEIRSASALPRILDAPRYVLYGTVWIIVDEIHKDSSAISYKLTADNDFQCYVHDLIQFNCGGSLGELPLGCPVFAGTSLKLVGVIGQKLFAPKNLYPILGPSAVWGASVDYKFDNLEAGDGVLIREINIVGNAKREYQLGQSIAFGNRKPSSSNNNNNDDEADIAKQIKTVVYVICTNFGRVHFEVIKLRRVYDTMEELYKNINVKPATLKQKHNYLGSGFSFDVERPWIIPCWKSIEFKNKYTDENKVLAYGEMFKVIFNQQSGGGRKTKFRKLFSTKNNKKENKEELLP